MPSATNPSLLARSSAVVFVIAISPFATFGQDNGPPRAVREFSVVQPQQMSPQVGKAFNEAISAMNAKRFDAARRAIGELRLDRLSPYERAKTEQVLFHIATAEEKLAEARQHLVKAIESGGFNEQETASAQTAIEEIDARLAAAPPP
jgi:hypothetical protein